MLPKYIYASCTVPHGIFVGTIPIEEVFREELRLVAKTLKGCEVHMVLNSLNRKSQIERGVEIQLLSLFPFLGFNSSKPHARRWFCLLRLFLGVVDANKEKSRGSIHPSKLYYLLLQHSFVSGTSAGRPGCVSFFWILLWPRETGNDPVKVEKL